jgi:hypothetical protein
MMPGASMFFLRKTRLIAMASRKAGSYHEVRNMFAQRRQARTERPKHLGIQIKP